MNNTNASQNASQNQGQNYANDNNNKTNILSIPKKITVQPPLHSKNATKSYEIIPTETDYELTRKLKAKKKIKVKMVIIGLISLA